MIVNADDWGRDAETTNCTLRCFMLGTITSVSAMVFMPDSERAATIARERRLDTGLHLNLTTPFAAEECPPRLSASQESIARYLCRHRLSQAVFNPRLVNAFEYVVRHQLEEFHRLYGADPSRIDGHHHMHLCANVLLQRLLPPHTLVRRNFSFEAGEKSVWNRLYRRMVDGVLARRHRVTDYFFSLGPLHPLGRLKRIVCLSRNHVVEVETHPINRDEYQFLAGGELRRLFGEAWSESP